MASIGPTSPTSTASNAYGEGGTAAWSNTSNVTASDNSRASVTLTGTTGTTIDSYSESNQNVSNSGQNYYGQSFSNTSKMLLTSVTFYLIKIGSPTGTLTAAIYAHDGGTFGSTGKPTGSALAISDSVNASTVSTSYSLIDFTFSGANQIVLSASTNYFVVVNFSATSNMRAGGDSTSPTHAGNMTRSSNGSSWTAVSTDDICFYVKGTTFINSEYILTSSYGFSIPTGATIDGIVVEVEQQQGTATVAQELGVKLIHYISGLSSNKATGATLPSSDGYVTYGSSSDLWGKTWTPDEINHSDFGAIFSVTAPSGAPTVDHIRITVYYTASGGSSGGGSFFQIF